MQFIGGSSSGAAGHAFEGRAARIVVVLVAVAVLLLGVVPAGAALVAPGASMLVLAEPAPTGAIIDTITSPFVTAFYSGSVTTNVIAGDGTNALGGLTFTYQVTLAAGSPGGVDRINGIDYTGWLTDTSFVAGSGTSVNPTTTDRGATGAEVGFNFVPPPLGLGELAPGTTSPLLVIQTNAPAYVAGTVNIIDGAVSAVGSFGPAIPEPAMLGFGMIGALGLLRRRA
jgi:hypothetical protein